MKTKSNYIQPVNQTLEFVLPKKVFSILLIFFCVIGTIGFVLVAIGCELPMHSLIIIGWILVGVGYIPILILLLIHVYINGIMW